MSANGEGGTQRPLSGWRAISGYLGCDPSTAKRWAASQGLPVHRPQFEKGRKGATVFAFPHEIGAWIRRRRQTAAAALAQVPASPAAIVEGSAVAQVRGTAGAGTVLSERAFGLETVSAEAQARYLDGAYLWPKRTPESLARARQELNAALSLAPDFAQAWSDLAIVCNLCVEYGVSRPEDGYTLARMAGERAIALEPDNARALSVLGDVAFFWARDFEGGLTYFRRARATDPGDVTTRHWFASALMALGRFAEAEREIVAARTIDSGSRSIIVSQAMIALGMGRAALCRDRLATLLDHEPQYRSPYRFLAFAELALGNVPAYLDAMARRCSLSRDAAGAAVVTAGRNAPAGHPPAQTAAAMLAVATGPAAGEVEPYFVAHLMSLAGRTMEAADQLGRIRTRHFAYYGIDPAFALARQDPAFRARVAELGLPLID